MVENLKKQFILLGNYCDNFDYLYYLYYITFILLSSFDSNAVCYIAVSLHILTFMQVLSAYKWKCNYIVSVGHELTPLVFSREYFKVYFWGYFDCWNGVLIFFPAFCKFLVTLASYLKGWKVVRV